MSARKPRRRRRKPSQKTSPTSALTIMRANCSETVWDGTRTGEVCQICGEELPEGSGRVVYCSEKCRRWFERNHIWRKARAAARHRDKYCCSRTNCDATKTDNLEVNHIVPLVGKGYGPGCDHHQTNLEVLCREHHVEVTRIQRNNRKKLSENSEQQN